MLLSHLFKWNCVYESCLQFCVVSIMQCNFIMSKADTDTAGGSGTATDTASEKNPSQVCVCNSVLKCKLCACTYQLY